MQDPTSEYTVIPIIQPYKVKLLEKYASTPTLYPKSSLCRFYMRGVCIMKPQFCKFAHGMGDIVDYPLEQLKKAIQANRDHTKTRFTNDAFFNQKPLFSVEPDPYNVLYDFQQQTKCGELSLAQINQNFDARNQLRTAMHEMNWSMFLGWLSNKYPEANMTIDWVQYHYNLKGFTKQHTHCKFGGLITWLIKSGRYIRYDLLLPPLSELKTTIIIDIENPRSADRLLRESGNFPKKLMWMAGSQREEVQKAVRGQIIDAYLHNKLPNEKTSLCEYYMRGSCIFSEEDCKFCHSFETLKYQPQEQKIIKQGWFQQKRLFIDKKPYYPSLFEFQKKIKDAGYKFLTLQQINKNVEERHKLRDRLAKHLYIEFMKFLQRMYPQAILTQSFVAREFHNVGFPKFATNRFQTFMLQLQEIGYCQGTYTFTPYLKQRKTYIFKIPDRQALKKYFNEQLNKVIVSLIKQHTQEQLPVLTQADIRKRFYENQEMFTIPLHLYLKRQGITMLAWLKRQVDTNLYKEVQFDFTDSLEKIKQQLQKYIANESKMYIHSLSQIETHIRSTCESGSLHCLKTGFRQFIVEELMALNQKIYFLSVNGEARVVPSKKPKTKPPIEIQCKCGKSSEEIMETKTKKPSQADVDLVEKYSKQRVVLVDNKESLEYARIALFGVDKVGVDLQGNLKKDGYIYLVQFGFQNYLNDNKTQVLVFDIFRIKRDEKDIYEPCRNLINAVLESTKCMKIMHDCKQDSVAIHQILQGCLKNVLDTCAMDLYIQQKKIYENGYASYRKLLETLQKVPGLNLVLEKYGRNGVNLLKQKMKAQFQLSSEIKESYFEARPIQPDFLEYAVRDVEDLVDVSIALLKQDQECIWKELGSIYSRAGVQQQK